jgi:cystathionine beta-lyase
MGKADFNAVVERSGTASRKWDAQREVFGTENLLPMWIADMDFCSPPQVVSAVRQRACHGIYGYPERFESYYTAFVEWAYRRYDWQIDPEWMLTTPGVVTAITASILAFTEPGDGVLIQPPVYPPFFSCPRLSGRTVIENPLVEDSDGTWRINFEDLARKLKLGPKLMVLCSPHNPVGRVWNRKELQTVAELCLENDVLMISDEIHGDLLLGGRRHIPLASIGTDVAARTIVCTAPSKTFNIAGLCTSTVIVSEPTLRAKLRHVLDALDICDGNVFGITAFEAAYRLGEEWLLELLPYLESNAEFMGEYLVEKIPRIRMTKPESTFLAWLDCRGLGLSQEKLKAFFIQNAKVGLNDGQTFGEEGLGYMRLNFGCSRQTLQQGLTRIEQAVKSL